MCATYTAYFLCVAVPVALAVAVAASNFAAMAAMHINKTKIAAEWCTIVLGTERRWNPYMCMCLFLFLCLCVSVCVGG